VITARNARRLEAKQIPLSALWSAIESALQAETARGCDEHRAEVIRRACSPEPSCWVCSPGQCLTPDECAR
jgi:hypothetical protein